MGAAPIGLQAKRMGVSPKSNTSILALLLIVQFSE